MVANAWTALGHRRRSPTGRKRGWGGKKDRLLQGEVVKTLPRPDYGLPRPEREREMEEPPCDAAASSSAAAGALTSERSTSSARLDPPTCEHRARGVSLGTCTLCSSVLGANCAAQSWMGVWRAGGWGMHPHSYCTTHPQPPPPSTSEAHSSRHTVFVPQSAPHVVLSPSTPPQAGTSMASSSDETSVPTTSEGAHANPPRPSPPRLPTAVVCSS